MKRKTKDKCLQGVTILAACIGVLFLVSILFYVFQKGTGNLSWELITKNYWATNTMSAPSEGATQGQYSCQESAGVCSEEWGIAVKDDVTAEKKNVLTVTYVAEDSPLRYTSITTAGSTQGNTFELTPGYTIETVNYTDNSGTVGLAGNTVQQDANAFVETLATASSIQSVYTKSTGGGIHGSLIATGYLMLISLLLSLPIGVMSAIYLHEYAKKSKFTIWIRSGIDMLTGIPSIVYGLMGVSVLFPVTQVFGCTTPSILLGGLTMAIILLPTIIRSTEEALAVVPKGLRDASLSLGATNSQTIFKVVLPCCMDGILTGVLLGVGRIIGESAALVYTMGTYISDTPTMTSQGTSLALMIWSFMSGEQPNFELACAVSIIILVVVLAMNIIVKLIGKRLHKAVA